MDIVHSAGQVHPGLPPVLKTEVDSAGHGGFTSFFRYALSMHACTDIGMKAPCTLQVRPSRI